jgi:hypothetical protein
MVEQLTHDIMFEGSNPTTAEENTKKFNQNGVGQHWWNQGSLTEGEDSVQLTSSLR